MTAGEGQGLAKGTQQGTGPLGPESWLPFPLSTYQAVSRSSHQVTSKPNTYQQALFPKPLSETSVANSILRRTERVV